MKLGDKLYISEGITDCLALLSADMKAVAIPSATILPLEDLVMLKSFDLHMYPDQDEAGQRAFMDLRRFFVNNESTLKAEKLPDGIKDYCEYYINTIASNGQG
jgi:DNA primase